MSNLTFQIASAAVVLAHAAVLAWAVLRADIRPALVLNVFGAAVLWLYFAPDLRRYALTDDPKVLALLAFTLLTGLVSLAGLFGLRVPAWPIWLQFAVQAAIALFVAVFAFTFKMRMF